MDFLKLPTVGVARCEGYSSGDYRIALRSALSHLGDMGRYIRPGQRVLLKPDLMYDYPGGCGCTTSPEFIAAVAALVRAAGGDVCVGDSPFILRGNIYDFWRGAGILDMARCHNLELVNFEMGGSRAVALETRVYYISQQVLDADVVINLPRVKYDRRTGFAGGIRNMLGTLPGFQKGRLYREFSGGRGLADVLVDIFSAVRPALTIAEAVPVASAPPSMNIETAFVLASDDTVALDAVVSDILRLDESGNHTTRAAAEAGLGIGWMEGIQVEGFPLGLVENRFRPDPAGGRKKFFQRVARSLAQPYLWMKSNVNGELCCGCGTCIDSCPTNAIQVEEGCRTPSINYSLCICCWAGLSNCPSSAIYLEESTAVRKLFPA